MTTITREENHNLVLRQKDATSFRIVLQVGIVHYSDRNPTIKINNIVYQRRMHNSLKEEYWTDTTNEYHRTDKNFALFFLKVLMNLPDDACDCYLLDPEFEKQNQASLHAIGYCFSTTKEDFVATEASFVQEHSPQIKRLLKKS